MRHGWRPQGRLARGGVALAAGEADAELAAAQIAAVEVVASAARRLVIGVLDEGVPLALISG